MTSPVWLAWLRQAAWLTGILGTAACGGLVAGEETPGTIGAGGHGAPDDAVVGEDARVTGSMVRVPAGTFVMGSDDGADDERPRHQVAVDAFEMDVTEVTGEAYRACVKAGGCTRAEPLAPDTSCDPLSAGLPNHPILCVSWNEATEYCAWAGKRLPTEEEWEYAARGTDGRTYPWGEDEPYEQLCWSGGSSGKREVSCAVGSFRQGDSPFGVADMAGSVWEWTASRYKGGYSSVPTENYVFRGGAFIHDNPGLVRSAARQSGEPLVAFYAMGFRCARSVE